MVSFDIDEKKASSFRKYIYEFCIFGLAASVVILFVAHTRLNADVRTVLMDLVVKSNVIIQDNSNALREIRIELKDTQRKP